MVNGTIVLTIFRKVKENIGFPLIVLIIEETIDIGAEGNKQKICY